MTKKIVGVASGLILAFGMSALLLVWLDRGEGAGITGLLFMVGIGAGIVTVVVGALSRGD